MTAGVERVVASLTNAKSFPLEARDIVVKKRNGTGARRGARWLINFASRNPLCPVVDLQACRIDDLALSVRPLLLSSVIA